MSPIAPYQTCTVTYRIFAWCMHVQICTCNNTQSWSTHFRFRVLFMSKSYFIPLQLLWVGGGCVRWLYSYVSFSTILYLLIRFTSLSLSFCHFCSPFVSLTHSIRPHSNYSSPIRRRVFLSIHIDFICLSLSSFLPSALSNSILIYSDLTVK